MTQIPSLPDRRVSCILCCSPEGTRPGSFSSHRPTRAAHEVSATRRRPNPHLPDAERTTAVGRFPFIFGESVWAQRRRSGSFTQSPYAADWRSRAPHLDGRSHGPTVLERLDPRPGKLKLCRMIDGAHVTAEILIAPSRWFTLGFWSAFISQRYSQIRLRGHHLTTEQARNSQPSYGSRQCHPAIYDRRPVSSITRHMSCSSCFVDPL